MPIYDWESGDEVTLDNAGSHSGTAKYPTVSKFFVGSNKLAAAQTCKDYIQDGFAYDIYHMQFKPDYLRLVFGASASGYPTELKLSFLNSLVLIHEIEDKMKIKRTVCKRVAKNSNLFYVRASRRWLRCPILLSMYITIMRVGGAYSGQGWQEYLEEADKWKLYYGDYRYLNDKTRKRMASIVLSKGNVFGRDIVKNWANTNKYPLSHCNSGIYAFANSLSLVPVASDRTLAKYGLKRVESKNNIFSAAGTALTAIMVEELIDV